MSSNAPTTQSGAPTTPLTTKAAPASSEQQQRSTALHTFLTSALRSGLCPDLELHAFGRRYPVHRLMLAQSPFFRSMLTGGWSEDSALKGCAPGSTAAFRLKFDDPNIGRTAFEYCLAALYGAEPKLVLPSWATPVPDQAFSAAWPHLVASVAGHAESGGDASEEHREPPPGSHVAHPRLLLSLLSTSLYLGIPTVSARALTLVLVSLTPWTVPMYLRYASGDGIDEPRYLDEEDEELDAPLSGFELGSELLHDDDDDEEQDEASMDTDDAGASSLADHAQRLHLSDEAAPSTPPPSTQRLTSPSPPPTGAPAKPRFDYGTSGSRIGEACACWLAGWGVDVLSLEEALDHAPSAPQHTARSTFAQPPPLALWSHPRKGGIPAAWVRGVLASDTCFVRSEADRWEVARRIIDLRRTQAAELRGDADEEEDSSMSDDSDSPALSGGVAAYVRATRTPSLDGHATRSRVQLTPAEEAQFDAEEEADEAEYAQLFAHGIYYTHMTFTELSAISAALSPHTGKAYTPLTVLQAALWAGAELKGRIQSASVGQGGSSSGRATSGESAAATAADDDDEPEAEDGRHDGHDAKSKEAVKDLGIASLLGDFEAAAARVDAPPARGSPARGSRAGTPLSSRHLAARESTPLRTAGAAAADASELGGIGAVGAALSLGGGKGALLDRRFFPVPTDDTLRLGESLISVASASAASALDNALAAAAEEAQHGSEGPLGLAAAREASTLPLERPRKKGNAVPRTPQTFFGVANTVRTGRALANESRELRAQQSQRPGEGDEGATSLGADTASSARLSFAPTLAPDEGDDSPSPSGATPTPSLERSRWTGYEPMRLGVEFYGVDTLVEKQRLYSPTFFYAGSIWNLYCQTLRKPKGVQLGVYLHRQSPSESIPSPSMPAHAAFPSPSATGDAPATGGVREGDSFLITGTSRVAGSSAGGPARAGINLTLPPNASFASTVSDTSSSGSSTALGAPTASTREAPAMPYRDARKVLRAFFAIHCPSPLGSALTSFSSGPDYFSVSQSWGWKSSSLLGATFHLDGALGSARTASAGEFRCVCTIGLI